MPEFPDTHYHLDTTASAERCRCDSSMAYSHAFWLAFLAGLTTALLLAPLAGSAGPLTKLWLGSLPIHAAATLAAVWGLTARAPTGQLTAMLNLH